MTTLTRGWIFVALIVAPVMRLRKMMMTPLQLGFRRLTHLSRSLAIFFFQAEDGIRDLTVTGVQTCALPISFRGTQKRRRQYDRDRALQRLQNEVSTLVAHVRTPRRARGNRQDHWLGGEHEIGRASGRGKWRSRGAADHLKKKKKERRGISDR